MNGKVERGAAERITAPLAIVASASVVGTVMLVGGIALISTGSIPLAVLGVLAGIYGFGMITWAVGS